MVEECLSQFSTIRSIQLRLEEVVDNLLPFQDILASRLLSPEGRSSSPMTSPDLSLSADNYLEFHQPQCPRCNRKLAKWGRNPRTIYLDKGEHFLIKGVQRYRCRDHGEIPIDLNSYIPRFANYSRSFHTRSRRLYFLGIIPAKITQVFRICYDHTPCTSSIRNWVDQSTEDIARVVHETNLPSSGYFGYDEIYLRTAGIKTYALTAIDLQTHFIPNAEFAPTADRNTLKSFIRSWKHGSSMQIHGIILDGTKSFGGLFKTRGYNKIAIQLCQTHYKKNLTAKIYAAAELGKQLKKELPELFSTVKQALFAPFNRSTRIRAEYQLIWADHCLRGKVNAKIDGILDHLFAHADKLFQYLVHQQLKPTNNHCERINKALEQYPSLKHQMRTPRGVNRVLHGEVFLHNYHQFQVYINDLEQKIAKIEGIIACEGVNADLTAALRGGVRHLWWVRRWQEKYNRVYDQYFRLAHE